MKTDRTKIPHDHAADGLALAAQVKPVRGKFVLLAIGMSNAVIEFRAFETLAASDSMSTTQPWRCLMEHKAR